MTERVRATIGVPGLPAREGFSGHIESLGFLPPPTSIETLRHIADTISGDGAFIMQGILRKAADELETAKERLQFLIDNEAHVDELHGRFRVFRTAWGDSEELTPYNKATGGCGWESADAAIDAARLAGERGEPTPNTGSADSF